MQIPSKTANSLEVALFGCRLTAIPRLIPGLAFVSAIVFASVFVADFVNSSLGFRGLISYIMASILIGLLVSNLAEIPAYLEQGVSFCLTKLLRLGIILLGIRLSFLDAAKIGAWGIPIVLACITTGLVLTTYFSRLLRLPDRLGTLMAIGTSICGATAIVAAAPVLQADDEEVAYAVANITVFGVIAMLVYPYLANWLFGGNIMMAGLFQGTAIHETAQVTGAGLIYDQTFHVTSEPTAADVSIVIKLVRNVFIAAVIPLMALVYSRRVANEGRGAASGPSGWRLFPLFILGFIATAILRSLGDANIRHGGLALGYWDAADWSRHIALVSDAAGYLLAMAMAGVGLGIRLKSLRRLGIKPFYVGLFAALVVGIVSAAAVFLVGPFVQI
jgi:uncharacterized integral membrane protein (TIGR00698 family)